MRDGADDVELTVDPSGIVVWAPDGSAPLAEVWLGGDAVRCDVVSLADMADEAGEALEDEAGDATGGDQPPVSALIVLVNFSSPPSTEYRP